MNRIYLNLLLALGITDDEVEKLGIAFVFAGAADDEYNEAIPKDDKLVETLSTVDEGSVDAVIDVKCSDAGLVEAEGMGAARAMEARARRLAKVGMVTGSEGSRLASEMR
jgi:hypothetical protein